MNTSYNLPIQKVPTKTKYADDCEWFKTCINAIAPYGNESIANLGEKDYRRMLRNYQWYNGILEQAEIRRNCDSFGIELDESMGAEEKVIIPYNIIFRKINKLLGEELRRGFNMAVYLINDKDIKERDEELFAVVREWVEQKLAFEIRKSYPDFANLPPEQQQQIHDEMVTKESPEEMNIANFLSQRQITTQKIIDFIVFVTDLLEKKNEAFKHALITDREMIFVGQSRGKVDISIVNPLRGNFLKSPEEPYINKGISAFYCVPMYAQDILDKYGRELKDEDFEKLSQRISHSSVGGSRSHWVTPQRDMRYYRDYYRREIFQGEFLGIEESTRTGSHGKIEHNHTLCWLTVAQWRGQREVIFWNHLNEYGNEVLDIMDEHFEIPPTATMTTYLDEEGLKQERYEWISEMGNPEWAEYHWIERIHETCRIDGDIFFRMRETPDQMMSMDNPYESELSFYGGIYNNTNAEPVSYFDRMRPFQFLYLVIMEKIRQLIGTDRGMVSAYDTSQLSDHLDDNETGRTALELTRFYERAESSVYYNSMTNYHGTGLPNSRPPGFQVANKSNAGFVQAYIQIADWCEFQCGQAGSITSSREGQTETREAVRNVQNNLVHAADMTEIWFAKHNRIWRDVIRAAVQKQKRLWKKQQAIGKGFSVQYVLPDLSIQTLKLKWEDLEDTDFGLFIAESGKESEAMNKFEQLTHALVQTDKLMASDIVSIIKSITLGRPLAEVERMIKLSEQRQMAAKNKEHEREMQAQREMQEAQKQLEQVRQENALAQIREKETERRKTEIQKASIVAQGYSQEVDIDNDGVRDVVETEQNLAKRNLEQQKINNDSKALEIERESLDVEREKIKQQSKQSKTKS